MNSSTLPVPSSVHPIAPALPKPAAPQGAATGPLFRELALHEALQRALAEKNYLSPSPIQAQAIPHLLAGKDLIGLAQTGTGKTAAFALPILHKLALQPKPAVARRCRALILVPTRELASQVGQSFAAYGKYLRLTSCVVFGGVGFGNQIRQLARGVDIIVATPGRLMDLERQKAVSFDAVEVFVLDEADRMLDLGFVHEVKRILAKLPSPRQSLLFSATMPPAIQELVRTILHHPVKVEVAPVSSTAERIEQKVCHVARGDKPKLLLHVLNEQKEGLVLVFVRMKHSANRLAEHLEKEGIRTEAIHGNKSQGARERALLNFRTGRSRILVATDIAARGIDVKGIALVVNFDLPEEPESYVHRIGRTARAGAAGQAIAFCDSSEMPLLRAVERLTRQTIPIEKNHPFPATFAMRDSAPAPRGRFGFQRGNGPRRDDAGPQAEGGRPRFNRAGLPSRWSGNR